MTLKTRCFVGLVSLSLVDALIPFPLVGAVLFYVVFQKPPWFRQAVDEFYRDSGAHPK